MDFWMSDFKTAALHQQAQRSALEPCEAAPARIV
jgi:hypothetical protein